MVWLVYDCEPHDLQKNQKAQKVFSELNQKRYWCPVVSHPCIEWWFLLHFDDPPAAKELSTAAKACTKLRKFLKNYTKGQIQIDELEKPGQRDQAKRRAAKLWTEGFPKTPATSIHLLVEALEDFKSSN